MGKRRMVCTDITRSDAFLEMPTTSRLLYYDLLQDADDEGFVDNPRTVMRITGATEDDMKILLTKKFIILPDETKGVVVIKHWFIHNYIRQDRLIPTNYKDLKALLSVDDNKAYTMADKCLTYDGQMAAQVKLSKDKLSKDKENIKHKHGQYANVLLSDDEMEKLKTEFPNDYEQRIERVSEYCASTGKSYKNYLATIRNWARKDKPQGNDLPTYVPTKNIMSKAEEEEILRLMGKQ